MTFPDLSKHSQTPSTAQELASGEYISGGGDTEWGHVTGGAHESRQGTRWWMWRSGHDNCNNSMLKFPFILKLPTITSGTDALLNLLWTSNYMKPETSFN